MCPLKIKCVTLNFWGRAGGYARGGGPLIVTLKKNALAAGKPTKIKGHDYGATPERYPKKLRVTPRPPPSKSPRTSGKPPDASPGHPSFSTPLHMDIQTTCKGLSRKTGQVPPQKNHLFWHFFHEKPRKHRQFPKPKTWVSLNRPEAPETAAPPPSKLTGGMKQI